MGIVLMKPAKQLVRMKSGKKELVMIARATVHAPSGFSYALHIAFKWTEDSEVGESRRHFVGRILVDVDRNWRYDGEFFAVEEQEQIGEFIVNHEIRKSLRFATGRKQNQANL
ncbi:MAG TPA: hypothetical protein VL442_06835 [Mucilaginibacter sp.]|jgi:hypothetical protein|nr:hypothetical protein [Mucilaginibacter sp.]